MKNPRGRQQQCEQKRQGQQPPVDFEKASGFGCVQGLDAEKHDLGIARGADIGGSGDRDVLLKAAAFEKEPLSLHLPCTIAAL